MKILALLLILTSVNVQAQTSVRDQERVFRNQSWAKYKERWCTARLPNSLTTEISLLAPELAFRTPTLNHKLFCECRVDGMNKALGADLASHLATADYPSLPNPDRDKFMAANKSVFANCLRSNSSEPPKETKSVGVSDIKLKQIITALDTQCVANLLKSQNAGALEFQGAGSQIEKDKIREKYAMIDATQQRSCSGKRKALLELAAQPEAKRVLPPGLDEFN